MGSLFLLVCLLMHVCVLMCVCAWSFLRGGLVDWGWVCFLRIYFNVCDVRIKSSKSIISHQSLCSELWSSFLTCPLCGWKSSWCILQLIVQAGFLSAFPGSPSTDWVVSDRAAFTEFLCSKSGLPVLKLKDSQIYLCKRLWCDRNKSI